MSIEKSLLDASGLVQTGLGLLGGDIKEPIKDISLDNKIKKELETYVSREQIHFINNYSCSEIDFDAVSRYITTDFIQDYKKYNFASIERQKLLYDKMVEQATNESKATKENSINYIKKLIEDVICIVQKIENNNVNRDDATIKTELARQIQKTEETVTTMIEKVGDIVISIQDGKNSKKDVRQYVINQNKLVKRQAVFPWFRGRTENSLSYEEAFPNLFVPPSLKVEKKVYEFPEFEKFNNLAIIGGAGTGKTTLLKYIFAFETHTENVVCIYFHASDIMKKDSVFVQAIEALNVHEEISAWFLIDGIDEAFYNDYAGFTDLVSLIKRYAYPKYNYWIACRSDFYENSRSERTDFGQKTGVLLPWSTEKEVSFFLEKYAEIVKIHNFSKRVFELVKNIDNPEEMLSNPFQLSLLAFLAEQKEEAPILGIYALYNRFILEWIEYERKRKTSRAETRDIIITLCDAAKKIYNGENYKFSNIAKENSAVKELLEISDEELDGTPVANLFYHRSLAAFFVAYEVIQAMCAGDYDKLRKALELKLKDDVTNFIGDYFNTLNDIQQKIISNNLQKFYYNLDETDKTLSAREQAIYFITRLNIDASNFLLELINDEQKNNIIRLTLAYGCVLSTNEKIRDFALDYAKSLSKNGEDAKVNRGWTVVYFGDVQGKDPYTYKDEEKGSWEKARNARIKRFTRQKPRKKDILFRLFDIPLFYTFLKSRKWNNISSAEYTIINNTSFPKEFFNKKERDFLNAEKRKLLQAYKRHLKKK